MVEKVAIKNNIIIPGVGGDPRAHELREVLKICSDKKIRIVVEEEERKVEEREKREEERKRKGRRRN